MFFNSQAYLIFFVIVFTVYWLSPWHRLRVYVLLAASFTFYAFWSKHLALLVASTTVFDYLFARAMDANRPRWLRRLLLGASLTINLGLLCYFKYANFFLDALRESLRAAGGSSNVPYLEVMIPFGISFYTFEAISYTIDVYSRKIRAERNLPNFMLFILFFPHLVAGPIVRARDFLSQAAKPKRFRWLRFQVGIEYFLIGLFKKMAIADNMIRFSDPVFAASADPSALSTFQVWLGVFAFAIRIYCDFSGYSDMAIGSAHMLGYKLSINFRQPYLSKNIAEFWRRWHISLSSWLRDYLFIPLGGSRGSRWLVARNLLITMTLGGLWHGANWSFVVWGLLHGSLLVIHRFFRDFAVNRPRLDALLQTWLGTLLRISLTFFVVSLCWIFFQPSLTRALVILHQMFTPAISVSVPVMGLQIGYLVVLLAVAQVLLMSGIWKRVYPRIPAPALGICYALLLIVSLILAPDTGKTFIYFQ
ncbi:MAG: MBOAT family protein, partial [Planctomycetes bacterium]|nr:MBOAT family protein [Planctomycetota bacterium]